MVTLPPLGAAVFPELSPVVCYARGLGSQRAHTTSPAELSSPAPHNSLESAAPLLADPGSANSTDTIH